MITQPGRFAFRALAGAGALALLAIAAIAFAEKGKEESLFNGKDLSGWKIHGTEKWYAKDGLLVCESGPDHQYGYLATDRKFKDFELTVDFKQETDGNSGVFFRCSLEGTKISGWQSEVAPPGHDSGGIYESYGRGWLAKPTDEGQKALHFGEWNTMKVLAVGDHVTTWLNGQQIVDLHDEKIGQATGQIALQIHAGDNVKVSWRNLRIKEL